MTTEKALGTYIDPKEKHKRIGALIAGAEIDAEAGYALETVTGLQEAEAAIHNLIQDYQCGGVHDVSKGCGDAMDPDPSGLCPQCRAVPVG